jgi:phage gp29-like protein
MPLNATIDPNGGIAVTERLFSANKPTTRPILNDVSAGFSSIVQIARDVLINPDIAYRTDRYLQEQMLRDPIIMGPLSERKLLVAQLPWEIVPEDEETDDQAWKDMAKGVERIVRRMMYQQDFFKQLLWADWRGTGAAEIDWQQDDDNAWIPAKSIPHHGDSITFDKWGNPRILTRDFQTGGRELTKDERDRLILHTYQPDAGFFYKGEEAGYAFKGRGLRDICWPYWWLSHNATRFWVRFIQRFGMGFVLGKYPMGNAQAKQAVESVLQNLIEDSNVSVPVPDDATDRESYGIEFPTMGGISEKAGVFKEFVEGWAGKHLRIIIIGQEQAHAESGDGLGSGRAEALQNTRAMYRDDSAKALQDTLTAQFIPKVQRFNFGVTPYRLKWKFTLERDNYKEQAERVKAAKDAGIQVTRAWIHEALRVPVPKPGEDIVDFGAQSVPLFGGAGGEGGAPLFGGASEADNQPLFTGERDAGDETAHTLFREAIGELDRIRG